MGLSLWVGVLVFSGLCFGVAICCLGYSLLVLFNCVFLRLLTFSCGPVRMVEVC